MILKARIGQPVLQEQIEPEGFHSFRLQQQMETVTDPNAPPGQQQQQQQQQTVIDDPFKDIDPDLLSDEVRKAVEASRTHLQSLQKTVAENKTIQSNYDKMRAEIERTQAELARRGGQQQQQQENLTPEQKFGQELFQTYRGNGFDDATAAKMVQINLPILMKLEEKITTQLAPMAHTVAGTNAAQIFEQLAETNPILEDPAVAQKTWDHVQNVIKQGMPVDAQFILATAKIFGYDTLEAKLRDPNYQPQTVDPQQQQQQQQQQQPSYPGAVRLHRNGNTGGPTYPGGGHNPNLPPPTRPVDAETLAAVSATVAHWDPNLLARLKVKPAVGKVFITRDGSF